MKTMKTLALAALLSASALGYSLNAHADSVGTSASGAGVSAGSSVGASNAAPAGVMNDEAATTSNTNSGVLAPNAINDQARDNGSTAMDNYSNSSTANSQVLKTQDSSSSDSLRATGTKNNTGQLAANNSGGNTMGTQVITYTEGQAVQSDQIASIQQSLKNHGYRLGTVDGIWGPRTANALRDFQSKNNLSTTGKLNAETASALNMNAVAPASGSNAPARMNDANDAQLNGNSPVDAQDNGTSSQY